MLGMQMVIMIDCWIDILDNFLQIRFNFKGLTLKTKSLYPSTFWNSYNFNQAYLNLLVTVSVIVVIFILIDAESCQKSSFYWRYQAYIFQVLCLLIQCGTHEMSQSTHRLARNGKFEVWRTQKKPLSLSTASSEISSKTALPFDLLGW